MRPPRRPRTLRPRLGISPRSVNIESLVTASSAAVGAGLGVGAVMRRYWTRRETRQQAAFAAAVGRIVDIKAAELVARQQAFEDRQGRHLDRQDIAIAALRGEVKQIRRRIGG